MKLIRIKIIKADTCGGLLDGLEVLLRSPDSEFRAFDPLCLVGPNGSGKSQFMQAVAEILQSICNACVPKEERDEANPGIEFELEYMIFIENECERIRCSRVRRGRTKPRIQMERFTDGNWESVNIPSDAATARLPRKVIAYTSGDNETLSLPFLTARAGYADEVSTSALNTELRAISIPETRLMLIDYSTNLEVLVATQLLSQKTTRESILRDSHVDGIHSCRCIIQLAGRSTRGRTPKRISEVTGRKGVQLTDELEKYLAQLQRCSTCFDVDTDTETYTCDYFITDETRRAFASFWSSALDLYGAFHKLAMLNDLAIPKPTRKRFRQETKDRRFASRLPEPPDEDKVFRFEQVKFQSAFDGPSVDYVSLSDGEHQRTQVLGTLALHHSNRVIFLMDEPESHFNPQWRVQFVTKVFSLPTGDGSNRQSTEAVEGPWDQEFIMTTHAPFVPSDMQSEKVFIFFKDNRSVGYRHPGIETYGTTFDSIIDSCFGVRPPISMKSRDEIDSLLESGTIEEIDEALSRLGHSVKKAFLIERLRQLRQIAEG